MFFVDTFIWCQNLFHGEKVKPERVGRYTVKIRAMLGCLIRTTHSVEMKEKNVGRLERVFDRYIKCALHPTKRAGLLKCVGKRRQC